MKTVKRKVRSWQSMVDEFGVRDVLGEDCIKCDKLFYEDMRHLCGQEIDIEVRPEGMKHGIYKISEDMLEPLEEQKEEFPQGVKDRIEKSVKDLYDRAELGMSEEEHEEYKKKSKEEQDRIWHQRVYYGSGENAIDPNPETMYTPSPEEVLEERKNVLRTLSMRTHLNRDTDEEGYIVTPTPSKVKFDTENFGSVTVKRKEIQTNSEKTKKICDDYFEEQNSKPSFWEKKFLNEVKPEKEEDIKLETRSFDMGDDKSDKARERIHFLHKEIRRIVMQQGSYENMWIQDICRMIDEAGGKLDEIR